MKNAIKKILAISLMSLLGFGAISEGAFAASTTSHNAKKSPEVAVAHGKKHAVKSHHRKQAQKANHKSKHNVASKAHPHKKVAQLPSKSMKKLR